MAEMLYRVWVGLCSLGAGVSVPLDIFKGCDQNPVWQMKEPPDHSRDRNNVVQYGKTVLPGS